jgi:hypothetical protein
MHWSAIIAGALAAAALSFVLLSFAAALGLSIASASPTWRDASAALWLLSGLFLILVALVSFALGGYIAGWLRTPWHAASPDVVEFRDGLHGVLAWGLAVVITALLVAATTAGVLSRGSTASAAPQASAAETLLSYELDRLFRGERRLPADQLSQSRAEAGRILLTASGHQGLTADDRAHLVRLVAASTGLAPADAERRVDDVVARSRTAVAKARRSGVILGFMSAAALLLGAAAAWFAACLGGLHRDTAIAPALVWPPGRPASARTAPTVTGQ